MLRAALDFASQLPYKHLRDPTKPRRRVVAEAFGVVGLIVVGFYFHVSWRGVAPASGLELRHLILIIYLG